jgi:hypothetical protein
MPIARRDRPACCPDRQRWQSDNFVNVQCSWKGAGEGVQQPFGARYSIRAISEQLIAECSSDFFEDGRSPVDHQQFILGRA